MVRCQLCLKAEADLGETLSEATPHREAQTPRSPVGRTTHHPYGLPGGDVPASEPRGDLSTQGALGGSGGDCAGSARKGQQDTRGQAAPAGQSTAESLLRPKTSVWLVRSFHWQARPTRSSQGNLPHLRSSMVIASTGHLRSSTWMGAGPMPALSRPGERPGLTPTPTSAAFPTLEEMRTQGGPDRLVGCAS